MTLDQLRERLRRLRIKPVADATGLHRNTISNIASGATAAPRWDTVQTLIDYLEGIENA